MDKIRFSRFAELTPDALALVDPQERCWSRGELASAVNRMVRALRTAGLSRGDCFAIVAPNCFEYLAAFLAGTQTGLYVVPINWHLQRDEILFILRDCEVRGLIVHEQFAPLARSLLEGLERRPMACISIGSIEGFTSLDDFVLGLSDAPIADPVMGRMLAYTSATTGRPKGVVLPLDQAEEAFDTSIARRMVSGALEEHVHLCASMLYHGAPLETAAACLHMGHAVVLTNTQSPEGILRLIDKHRVTYAYMVPTLFGRLLSLEEQVRAKYSLSSLRRIVHAGAPCPVDIKRRMIAWLGPILSEVYGATEGGGTIVGSEDWLRHPGTVGKPIPGSRVRILDDQGGELPAGKIGTIYMTRFSGDRFQYHGDPAKTEACHVGDFFTVGDVGYVNEEGFLFICDRSIDMIICSGMKVYSAEVENVLIRHPSVADCAIIGVPDELTGEAVVAIVQLNASCADTGELRLDMRRFLGEHLAAAKVPRRIVFAPQLPRDPTGKLQKKRLREQYRAI